MTGFEKLVEDFSRHPVPREKTVSGLRVALIVIGVMITLPAFLTSAEIGHNLGLTSGAVAFVAGGLILAAACSVVAVVAAQTRLSTYMILQFSFGTWGGKLVNLIICVTLFGWFGISLHLFSETMQSLLKDLAGSDYGTAPFLIAGGVLMTATAVFGFKALDKLAVIAVPLLLFALITIVFASLEGGGGPTIAAAGGSGLGMGNAISAVVGGMMVGVTLFPDLCRYVRDARHGIIAAIMSFALGYPLVMIAAAIPSLATGEREYLLILTGLGMGISALAVLVFATWTTNISNLYSASLLLATMFRRVAKWKLTILAGLLGTLSGSLGIMDVFLSYLVILGVSIPPIVGIYVTDFFLVKQRDYNPEALASSPYIGWTAFASWAIGFAFAFAASNELIRLTGIPACDSALVAAGTYFALSRLGMHNR
jgi:cytosine permease